MSREWKKLERKAKAGTLTPQERIRCAQLGIPIKEELGKRRRNNYG
ncbi:MAG: hypothetical protein ACFFDT_00200 [Candidatus Hodarchaeota archaeon]